MNYGVVCFTSLHIDLMLLYRKNELIARIYFLLCHVRTVFDSMHIRRGKTCTTKRQTYSEKIAQKVVAL